MATKLSDALDTAKEGWTADDFDALETKVKELVKDLGQVQSSTGLVGGGMYAVGAAYAAFWAFAVAVTGYMVYLGCMVLATMATPAGPGVRAAAEANVTALNSALDAMLAKLGLVVTTTGALLGAVAVAGLSGMKYNPVAGETATLKSTKIEWAPPNQWISPKKEEPVGYAEASGADTGSKD
ncbi:hypothetical protein [Actinoplanes philippinensis]|uniref:hypothetical protein n=1 Tax=Actinoplanes philippinensis TaxID=35752 RepID=UPI0033DA506C